MNNSVRCWRIGVGCNRRSVRSCNINCVEVDVERSRLRIEFSTIMNDDAGCWRIDVGFVYRRRCECSLCTNFVELYVVAQLVANWMFTVMNDDAGYCYWNNLWNVCSSVVAAASCYWYNFWSALALVSLPLLRELNFMRICSCYRRCRCVSVPICPPF